MIRQQRGETLIEVMVASIVLAIGILGCVTLQTKSVLFNQQSLNYTLATVAMDSVANTIRSSYKSKIYNTNDFNDLVQFPITSIEVIPNKAQYEIVVQWRDRAIERELSLDLYVGNPQLVVTKAYDSENGSETDINIPTISSLTPSPTYTDGLL